MTDSETMPDNTSETVSSSASHDAQKETSKSNHIDLKTNSQPSDKKREYGGRSGPNPTRYGDWESKGRCVDF